jgi:hypothetical protein
VQEVFAGQRAPGHLASPGVAVLERDAALGVAVQDVGFSDHAAMRQRPRYSKALRSSATALQQAGTLGGIEPLGAEDLGQCG